MDSSVLIAKFLGPLILVIGAGLFLNTKTFRQIAEDFFKNKGLLYLGGLTAFVMGLAIVIFNNIWAADWRVIITVFGWMTLIKGVWLIVFPGTLAKMADVFVKNTKVVLIPWGIMIVLGIILTIKGYS